jgi:hypothetical protein
MNRYSKCIATIDEWLEPIISADQTKDHNGGEHPAHKFGEKVTQNTDKEQLL